MVRDAADRTRGIKAKGTSFETAVVDYMREQGWLHVERHALHGANDRGDIAGVPGVAIEVKSGARLKLPQWMAETETERVNDKATYGLLVVKPVGVGKMRMGKWWAIKPFEQELQLLREAGYG